MFAESELETILLFLGPTIVAAVISGLFSLVLSRRSDRMNYITAERSKWRDKIRQISENLKPEKKERLKYALNALKLNINAYGMEDSINPGRFEARYILMDTHIWVLIYQIENAMAHGKRLEQKCELLRKYLSLLLKYDWERAKNEVNRSMEIIFGWIFMIISMISAYMMPLIYTNVNEENIDVIYVFIVIIAVVFVIACGNIFEKKVREILRKNAVSEFNGFKRIDGQVVDSYKKARPLVNHQYNNYTIYSVLCKLIIFMVGYFGIAIAVEKLCGIHLLMLNIACIGLIIIYGLGSIMVAIEKKRILTNEYAYLVEINRLSSGFYEIK